MSDYRLMSVMFSRSMVASGEYAPRSWSEHCPRVGLLTRSSSVSLPRNGDRVGSGAADARDSTPIARGRRRHLSGGSRRALAEGVCRSDQCGRWRLAIRSGGRSSVVVANALSAKAPAIGANLSQLHAFRISDCMSKARKAHPAAALAVKTRVCAERGCPQRLQSGEPAQRRQMRSVNGTASSA